MLIKQATDLRYSDITPKSLYLNRRKFLAGVPAAFVAGGELLSPSRRALAGTTKLETVKSSLSTTGEKITPYDAVTHYNNYYEFGTGKEEPAEFVRERKFDPGSNWAVSVEGDVAKPRKFTVAELMKLAPLEERVYRHRCVEAWSVVVPWIGYSLSTLLKAVEPTDKAKYVAFETLYDPKIMLSPFQAGIPLPYVEGLRLDEANHPLTLLCFGMYGETLPPQDGAPLRTVIPWKYGFKSTKSIVKIRLVAKQPPATWNDYAPREYGFYSNVNPNRDHPRWSQKEERRLGEFFKRKTLMFNGYPEVASLYSGMDLIKNY
jgi:methionine sulfoxide reductase catalytic subunit